MRDVHRANHYAQRLRGLDAARHRDTDPAQSGGYELLPDRPPRIWAGIMALQCLADALLGAAGELD